MYALSGGNSSWAQLAQAQLPALAVDKVGLNISWHNKGLVVRTALLCSCFAAVAADGRV